MQTLQRYKSIDGKIYNTRNQALKADARAIKDRAIARKQSRCKHDFKIKTFEYREDVGHHDWVTQTGRLATCKKCRYKTDHRISIDIYLWEKAGKPDCSGKL